jgi:hypothetical protein
MKSQVGLERLLLLDRAIDMEIPALARGAINGNPRAVVLALRRGVFMHPAIKTEAGLDLRGKSLGVVEFLKVEKQWHFIPPWVMIPDIAQRR